MALTILEAASTRNLTTIDAVMAEIDMGDQVLLVEQLIRQASAAIERLTGRVFAQQHYRQTFWRDWHTQLFLKRVPVIEDSIEASLDGLVLTDVRVENAEAGILWRDAGWGWHRWGIVDDGQVDYIAGYILPGQVDPPDPLGEVLPADVERAAIEASKVWLYEREVSSRVTSKTFGLTGDRIEYRVSAGKEGLPRTAVDILLVGGWLRMAVA